MDVKIFIKEMDVTVYSDGSLLFATELTANPAYVIDELLSAMGHDTSVIDENREDDELDDL